jgi:hypothetical protein
MTIEDIKNALERQTQCEFYSSSNDWVAWLDKGWHKGMIVALDEAFPCVTLLISKGCTCKYTIVVEVRGEDDMGNLLRMGKAG